jgi:hypothetical protein
VASDGSASLSLRPLERLFFRIVEDREGRALRCVPVEENILGAKAAFISFDDREAMSSSPRAACISSHSREGVDRWAVEQSRKSRRG